MKYLLLFILLAAVTVGCQSTRDYQTYSPPGAVDYGGAVSAWASSGSCPSCH